MGAKRVEGAGGLGATGRDPGHGLITHLSRSLPTCDGRGGGRQERGIQPQSLLEASRPALMGFPEAPGRLGGVGSVSAPPARERLAGGTLRFPRSLREGLVGAYSVSCAVLGAQRGPRWPGPACP